MIFWLAIPLTLMLYFATRALYRKLPWPIINPVLVPTAVIIGLLLWFDLPLGSTRAAPAPSRPCWSRRWWRWRCPSINRPARSRPGSNPS